MSLKVLRTVSDAMDALGLEYGFMIYGGNPIVYPYFVGSYTDSESVSEDGLQDSTFTLTGFHRGTWLELETAKESIESYFNPVSGHISVFNDGGAVAMHYASGIPIPTGDAELQRIQINIHVKEWKVI